MQDLSGRRVTVMGLGRFGGGLGVTRWLVGRGADVLVTDLEPESKLAESVQALQDLISKGRVTLRLGGHNVSDFTTCDLVVANPAVPKPWDNRFLKAAEAAGIPVTTEIGLTIDSLPDRARVIGVTGTAGKSTTSAMIAHILSACGHHAVLAGNIGGSLLESLDQIGPRIWVVLELSSFMLHWLDGWSPRFAAITNITANHLDWHGSFEHYRNSKLKLLRWQQAGDTALRGEDVSDAPVQPGVRAIVIPANAGVGDLAIPGAHNQRNAAMAIAAVHAAEPSISLSDALDVASRFAGLPHRLEFIAEMDLEGHAGKPVRFYNDSKSTTPEATLLALKAFSDESPEPRVHLIAGGYDKGSDLTPIARSAASLKGLYAIGATGPSLLSASVSGKAISCGTLDCAVSSIFRCLEPGDIVLLSPGCASWDQFSNYEERGRAFAALVNEHLAVARTTS